MKAHTIRTATILITGLACTALVAGPTASAQTSNQGCNMRLNMSDTSEVSQWQTVLDGVMGGRSTGAHFAETGHMTFRGRINTNGGGFSSLRRAVPSGAMTGAKSVQLRIRQDTRTYKMTFRTNERIWGRPVSYQLNIPKTEAGVWTDVTLPLAGFRTSIFGREVQAAKFDPAQVREIGIIIADGIDGPFQIDVAAIACS